MKNDTLTVELPFVPRSYQVNIINAIEKKTFRNAILIWPRRSGKDITAFNIAIRQAIRRKMSIYYIFPTYSQAKKAIWQAITNDGTKFMDFIPQPLIYNINNSEMRITFINGSFIQFIGSDNPDRLRGTNPHLCIFSEYATQNPVTYPIVRPILAANNGIAIFVSTPSGMNHFFDLYMAAKESKFWYTELKTVDDLKHIPISVIQQDVKEGIISQDMVQSEYYCSFKAGASGAYYRALLDEITYQKRAGHIPWDSSLKVYTAWDIGHNDPTSIIFFQVRNSNVYLIDFYENTRQPLEHYIKVVREKPYEYGAHIAPHDIKVHDYSANVTRLQKAAELGFYFFVEKKRASISDGIEAVKTMLRKTFIDEIKCKQIIDTLANYAQQRSVKTGYYLRDKPVHDKWSHTADALRYLAVSYKAVTDIPDVEDLNKIYREVKYGNNNGLPRQLMDF